MSELIVRVRDNGPIVIEGPVKIFDAEGNELTQAQGKPAVALCRCGGSQRKPFCDGAHKSNGFESCVRAANLS